MSYRVSFNCSWDTYLRGFGDDSFWLGLNKIHQLTTSRPHELQIELYTFENTKFIFNYNLFSVGPGPNYELSLSGFTGSGYDAMNSVVGRSFSTPDRDQDSSSRNCALDRAAGWWTGNCHQANLNGEYLGNQNYKEIGIWWKDVVNKNLLNVTIMSIRPVA